MTIYVRVEDDCIVEIFRPLESESGKLVPIENRFHPDFVRGLAIVADESVECGWVRQGDEFVAPKIAPSVDPANASEGSSL